MSKIILLIILSLASYNITASTSHNRANIYFQDPYNNMHYNKSILIGGFLSLGDGKEYTVRQIPSSETINFGYGGMVSLSIDFNNKMGVEFGAGLGEYHIKSTAIDPSIYLIPMYATIKTRNFPYGPIAPYFGIGLHRINEYISMKGAEGTTTSAEDSEDITEEPRIIDNVSTYGVVLQVGCKFMQYDNWFYNIDFKYFYSDTENKSDVLIVPGSTNYYDKRIINNPMIFTFGVGMNF